MMAKHDTTMPPILHVVYTKRTGAGFTKWTSRVINCLGNPETFLPKGAPLSEHAELGMALGEPGTGGYSG